MNDRRSLRLESLIREKIGVLIVEGYIKDPRVEPFLTVTRVSVAGDLAFADVFVSGHKGSSWLVKGVAGLQSAAGFIQAMLNKELKLRHIPKLRFHADFGIRDGFELNQKIDELVAPSS